MLLCVLDGCSTTKINDKSKQCRYGFEESEHFMVFWKSNDGIWENRLFQNFPVAKVFHLNSILKFLTFSSKARISSYMECNHIALYKNVVRPGITWWKFVNMKWVWSVLQGLSEQFEPKYWRPEICENLLQSETV